MFSKIFGVIKSVLGFFKKTRLDKVIIALIIQKLEEVAKKTTNKTDDKLIDMAKSFCDNSNNLNTNQQKEMADIITKIDTGSLSEFCVGYNPKKGVTVANDIGKLTYNPKNGDISYNIEILKQ